MARMVWRWSRLKAVDETTSAGRRFVAVRSVKGNGTTTLLCQRHAVVYY